MEETHKGHQVQHLTQSFYIYDPMILEPTLEFLNPIVNVSGDQEN